MLDDLQRLFDAYGRIQIPNQNRYFSSEKLYSFLKRLEDAEVLNIKPVGESENRNPIYKVSIGSGPIKVMAWSQMHGNEATGTLALLELYSLFAKQPMQNVWNELTFVSVIMVNPDGADVFQRRNASNIDLNRDAQAKSASETRVLVQQIQVEKPDVALNLHDQRNIFGVSGTVNPATISFLAPSFNREREVNTCRVKCMMLIAGIAQGLERQIGAHVGKYNDEYYPTAFGEYVQAQGIPCILIESGASINDKNREVARKMNVYGVLKLFSDLIDNSWKKRSVAEYTRIPENNTDFFDIIIKNIKLETGSRTELIDLGLLIKQELSDGALKEYYQLTDMGDLSFKHGLEMFDAFFESRTFQRFELNQYLTLDLPRLNLAFKQGVRIKLN